MSTKKSGSKVVIIVSLVALILTGGYFLMSDLFTPDDQKLQARQTVVIETSKGAVELELFPDKAPETVKNFITLAEEGFYEGTRFHRVIENFMIQGGCPHTTDVALQYAWGTGDPGYKFDCEIHDENFNVKGTIAMANAGPNTNGSQFFINVNDNVHLNRGHTVFGRVISGMDVVLNISRAQTGQRSIPLEDVFIKQITVK